VTCSAITTIWNTVALRMPNPIDTQNRKTSEQERGTLVFSLDLVMTLNHGLIRHSLGRLPSLGNAVASASAIRLPRSA
jgi:hypothetical protein